ncbi:MAG: tRNA (guanosine(37)-N1)-methyltransferase TrmD [Clostridia bacterium]|jgi:tRNA (guanine37-N1)-methyltransferase|nr:tRNA (guanosine(37)-N1)-methyltransferase TrmD [Clostridia bacterium]MDD4275792.1 tRNA (guanosine(37)-N1)-methyltransferase TrmD [Clostridia bacterium]
MKIDVLTLFPEMFSPLNYSIIERAKKAGILDISITDIRNFAKGKHQQCDDYPYGGGAGMVMIPEPIHNCLKSVKTPNSHIVYMSAKGSLLNQTKVEELSKYEHLIILCGHYEGVDQRILDQEIDEEICIGDYVLTGGELPAMVLLDAVARYVPNVLTGEGSLKEESFSNGLLEYPQYTRPQIFNGESVPGVLLSGNHQEIDKWRKTKILEITKKNRPDIFKQYLKKEKIKSMKEQDLKSKK